MWTWSQDITWLLLAFKMEYIFINSLIYLLSYLWIQRNIQTWNNCRLVRAILWYNKMNLNTNLNFTNEVRILEKKTNLKS